jgi:(R,R)-butanediol dehydrogenase/meso-butanediol dehydrogenase/diacetyl reductase
MQAALYNKEDRRVSLAEIETPVASDGMVVIKVERTGICGSDFSAYSSGGREDGVILGHEYSGTIEDPGDSADLAKGDRVTVMPVYSCGVCPECRRGYPALCHMNIMEGWSQSLSHNYPGSFAQYTRARADCVFPLPDHVDFAEGAMTEPMAVALRAVRRAGVVAGSRVLITGAGFIATAVAALARLQGADFVCISARTPEKAQIMLETGIADLVLGIKEDGHVDRLVEATGGIGYDYGFECTGSADCFSILFQAVRNAGRIGVVGAGAPTTVDMTQVMVKELALIGSVQFDYEDFRDALAIIASGRVKVKEFITSEISLHELDRILLAKAQGQLKNDVKVMVDPWT